MEVTVPAVDTNTGEVIITPKAMRKMVVRPKKMIV